MDLDHVLKAFDMLSDVDFISHLVANGLKPKLKKKLKYKGYVGKMYYSKEDNILWGKIKNIDGLVTFESVDGSINSLREQFEIAVDEFIEDLKEIKNDKKLSYNDFLKFGNQLWFNQTTKPEVIIDDRDGRSIRANYSYPIIYSNGRVGYWNSESNKFIVDQRPSGFKQLLDESVKWTYFPCKSDPENYAKLMYETISGLKND